MKEKTIKIECPSCDGTGLYKGMCERDNCAVICSDCKGKGYINYHYNEFNGLKHREDINRVFYKTYGYVHSDKDCVCDDGTVLHFENYGCTYEEWLNGKNPKPMEELFCPYYFYNQGIGNEPLLCCQEENNRCGLISNCPNYKNKELCWHKFNKRLDINPAFDFERANLKK